MAEVQGSRKNFQLHTIGWQAFQDLACSVSEVEFDRVVHRIAKTSDQGRDGFFYGLPDKHLDGKDERETTIQCKHTADPTDKLKKSVLKNDLDLVTGLVESGRAAGYILFSNAKITEGNRKEISDAIKEKGVPSPHIHGAEWITQKILEHPKVRALVPRVYGLGDLSWITDERSKKQAEAILASMGGDLACYVPTKAHRKAVDALNKHRVVLLLGNPAVGKSTIAAALAASATDEANCEVFFVRNPEEFLESWDPTIGGRLFWIDDAFGSIQFRQELMDRWNKVLTSFRAATQNGNRFIITSRSYIWRQAIKELKNGVFPPLQNGKVTVNVEDLTLAEKERILYNHLKFGSQNQEFLKRSIPFLDDLAASSSFRPEMARRLGDPAFTKNVVISKAGIEQFFSEAPEFLLDTLRDLERPFQAALGLIFIENGKAPIPLEHGESTALIAKCYGSDIAELGRSLSSLQGSFVNKIEEPDEIYWTFKHPTIADAFSALIAEEDELIELYVEGCKISRILAEVKCGEAAVEGSFVPIPPSLFDKLVQRIADEAKSNYYIRYMLKDFLLKKCGDTFLRRFFEAETGIQIWDFSITRPTSRDTFAELVMRTASLGCLPENERADFLKKLENQIVSEGDVDFLISEPNFDAFLSNDEKEHLKSVAKGELLSDLEDIIENEAQAYEGEGDPDYHFDDLKYQIEVLEDIFPDDKEVGSAVFDALQSIDSHVDELKFEYESGNREYDDEQSISSSEAVPSGGRSIFDDLA